MTVETVHYTQQSLQFFFILSLLDHLVIIHTSTYVKAVLRM